MTMEGFQQIRGFTLLELMVVIAIVAIVSAGAVLVIPDSSQTALERDGQRMIALLDTARAHSRASGLSVTWQATQDGFQFNGLPQIKNAKTGIYENLISFPTKWLSQETSADASQFLVLGPEPILAKQEIVLRNAGHSILITTDGLRPFTIKPIAESVANDVNRN